jgi:hypothetical protein
MDAISFSSAILLALVGPAIPPVISSPYATAPPGIAVVKTWQELHAQPAIDLGDGVKVHLGIAADKCPQWGAVFLYCLTDGYVPANDNSGYQSLGPVVANFRHEKDLPYAGGGPHQGEKNEIAAAGHCLFVQMLAPVRTGTYRVDITNQERKLIAKTALECTSDAVHPWMPWFFLSRDTMGRAEGIALPAWRNTRPVATVEAGKELPVALPTVVPTKPAWWFKVSVDGDDVLIHSALEFTASRPDYHFLTRWWVNDKPFVPKQIKHLFGIAGYGRLYQDTQKRIPLKLMPQHLGAKPGDKIGLQLLYCPNQWALFTEHESLDGFGGPEEPWLSNRVDFIAPEVKAQ